MSETIYIQALADRGSRNGKMSAFGALQSPATKPLRLPRDILEPARQHSADLNRKRRPPPSPSSASYAAVGHPSVEDLMAEQSMGPIADASILHGDSWPEEETIEEVLAALHEWRGHVRTDPAA